MEKIKELKRRRIEKLEKNENKEDEDTQCLSALVGYENNWKVWRTTADKIERKVVEIQPTEQEKLYPIFHKTSAKIRKPKLNTTDRTEATEFDENDDAHCISALLTQEYTEIQHENMRVQEEPAKSEVPEPSNCRIPEIVVTQYSTSDMT